MRRFAPVFCAAFLLCVGVLPSRAAAQEATYPSLSFKADVEKTGGDDVAFIVAIEDYLFVDHVEGATRAANDWEGFFRESLGVQTVHIVDHTMATREEIERQAQIVAHKTQAGGRLWFVFIGLGAYSQDGGRALLLGVDTQRWVESFEKRGIDLKALLNTLGAGNQAETVAILDTSFGGLDSTGDPLVLGRQASPAKLAFSFSKPTVVLVASQPDQFAGPLPGLRYPAFSYLLQGALRGWGGAGEVTAQQATNYVTRTLRGVPRRHQTPTVSGESSMVLVRGSGDTPPTFDELFQVNDCDRTVMVGGGTPSCCPEGYRHNGTGCVSQTPVCAAGKIVPDGTSTCCWPGQRVASNVDMCVSQPTCPAGTQYDANTSHLCVTTDLELLLRTTCEAGRIEICSALADRYRTGRGVPKDPGAAQRFTTAACRKGSAYGCALEKFMVSGNDADLAEARSLGCASGLNDVCRIWGKHLALGLGVKRDLASAAEVFESSCAWGSGENCLQRGFLLRVGGRVSQEFDVTYLSRACDLGESEGCSILGVWYMKYRDPGFPDRAKARVQFQRACDMGNANACGWLRTLGPAQ